MTGEQFHDALTPEAEDHPLAAVCLPCRLLRPADSVRCVLPKPAGKKHRK